MDYLWDCGVMGLSMDYLRSITILIHHDTSMMSIFFGISKKHGGNL